jgi:hypothetical protein
MEKGNFKYLGWIRKSIKENRESALKNAPLEVEWGHHDSSLDHLSIPFFDVLPEKYKKELVKKNISENVKTYEVGDVFKKYITDTLSESKKENPQKKFYGIEFGGPGSRFFEDFEGFFEKSAGICLADIRGKEQKQIDESNKHYVIAGDFMDPFNSRPYIDILHKIKKEKVDLIISRMQGGLKEINRNPVVLHNIFNKWYKMLEENGLMFVQFDYLENHNAWLGDKKLSELKSSVSSELEKRIKAWAEAIKKKYPEIDITVANGVFRLQKNSGSPKELEDVRSEIKLED